MDDVVGAHGDDCEACPYAKVIGDLPNPRVDLAAWRLASDRHADLHWGGNIRAVITMRAINGLNRGSCIRNTVVGHA